MAMRQFILGPFGRHLGRSLLTLWAVTAVLFIITELSPGDFATATATRDTTRAVIEATRFELGLYAPALDRYAQWLFGILQGDLGQSWWARKPVAPLIANRLMHSGWLVAWATALTIPLALGLAITAVAYRRSLFDRVASATSIAAMSSPEFLTAYALMAYLGVYHQLFPVITTFALDISFTERLHATALPVLSLTAVTVTPVFRTARAALLTTMSSEYILMARIKGVDR